VVVRGNRAGFFLLEVVISLLLLSLLVSMGWIFFARQREVGRNVFRRASDLETVRTVAWLLGQETKAGRPGVDWVVGRDDSLSLRAFRGVAIMDEGSWVGNRVRVCFRGHRSPAPEKDSVLVMGPDGSWTALDLRDRVRLSSDCPGMVGWQEEVWTISEGRPGAILGRLYERGSYHLANGALRYERGDGGRQPLTPENLEVGSFLGPSSRGRGVRWELTLKDQVGEETDAKPRTWRGGR
jgi:hypothetical protein